MSSKVNSKYYTIYDSNKNIWYKDVFSLAAFCKENSLYESSMRDVSKGRQLYQHRGFFCIEKFENDVEVLEFKINKKKFLDVQTKFNKIKKPLDKHKRYNQNNNYIEFIDNIKEKYEILHVKEKKSCKKIADIIEKSAETVRKIFIKNGYNVINHNIQEKNSIAENNLKHFLNEVTKYNFSSTFDIIKPLEIDCYSENSSIAFEYCGMYWHSELFKDRSYHKNKMKLCEEKNIRLITIFENEWIHKNKQVKQFIKSTFGSFDKRIYARDCNFKQIESQYDFFQDNHIQGSPHMSEYTFGIFKNDELLGAISYAHHHRKINSNDTIVLNRLAFKNGIQVIGGASKLIKNSLKLIPYNNIVTWSDNRWSTGKIYKECGFTLDANLPVDYIYYNLNTYETKSKQSMKKSLINCGNMTEHEWAIQNKWVRIYDCGKKRWIYKK
jgi:hypothetical protein